MPIRWVENPPSFLCTEKSDCLAQFFFQYEVLERRVALLLVLHPASLTQISRRRVKCVFHKFVKHPTIPVVKLKQYFRANMFGIINALGAFQYN